MKTQVDEKTATLLFLVAWDRPDLWDYFRRWFSGVETVQVILDRRRGERRKATQAHEPGQRREDRRRQLGLDDEVRSSGFAITRLEDK